MISSTLTKVDTFFMPQKGHEKNTGEKAAECQDRAEYQKTNGARSCLRHLKLHYRGKAILVRTRKKSQPKLE